LPTAKKSARLLAQLEAVRARIGDAKEDEFLRLLRAAGRIKFGKDAESLIRFHDLLLFLRAFPPGPRVLRLADTLLRGLEPQVKAGLAAGADPDDFAPEEVVGIAGTVVEASFSYPMVCWLVERYPKAVSINWEGYEREVQRAAIWPRFLPLLEEDSLTEANVPYRDWLQAARGRQDELLWLVRRFQQLPVSEKEKAALYDSLEILVRWDMTGSPASRTLSRRPVRSLYFHQQPLIQRRDVSIAEQLAKPSLPIRRLSPREAGKTLDLVKAATGVRYRELYGTANADPSWVVQSNVGRGVEVYFWGLPPEKRLPLRAYLAGFTLKNGVPINYVECISLFEWTEIGFNTFPAYRDGETAWIYAQHLRLLCQLHGTSAISVYPYQIGDGNEEAIDSGAFWFYRKLGFRSMNPELEELAQREEKRIRANPRYRTSARTLRRLSKAHVVYETSEAERGAWDRFAMRNIGFAVQRRMARDFAGGSEAMRRASIDEVAPLIHMNPQQLPAAAQTPLADFSTVLALIPDFPRWPERERYFFGKLISAKSLEDEQQYQLLLRRHPRFRAAILKLGSN
jgi:hypothetical protein